MDARRALEAVEYLHGKYRAAADQLEPVIAALREVVESGEFTEQRRQAVEAARPFLSPNSLVILGQPPSGAVLPPKPRTRKDKWFTRGTTQEPIGDD